MLVRGVEPDVGGITGHLPRVDLVISTGCVELGRVDAGIEAAGIQEAPASVRWRRQSWPRENLPARSATSLRVAPCATDGGRCRCDHGGLAPAAEFP